MTAPPELLGPLAAFRGQRVLLGVSGGADSVGLLLALLEAGVEVAAGHLDHALRPGSAGDAAWVAALCERLGVPLYSERTEVGRVAAERGWNLEDAARRLRYSFLSRAAKAAGAGALLTAHTRRDQAETVLWQLLRGEASLPGIPARRGRVWRPWLGAERESIEGYLRVSGQDWRDDESNLDPRYTRNWLRHEVMPALSARFPGLEGSLARLAAFQAEDDDALSDLAARLTDHAPRAGLPLAVLRRFVRLELRRQGVRDVRAGQLAAAAGALREGRTLHLDLPGATPLTVTGGRVLSGPPTVSWPLPDFLLPPGWALRHRKDGDRLRRPGGSRKLSDVLTDAHVPRAERDELWLLAREADVQWLGLSPPVWAVGAREAAGQLPDPLHAAMGEALELARAAAERGEVPVGALVLCGGEVVARAANSSVRDGDLTRHAELEVLRQAARVVGPLLGACTLVVTLEPCPMCLGAALEARLARLVYGASNPKAGALGGVSDLLAHHWGHRPQVQGGVRAAEAARLLRSSFRALRRARAEDGG